MLGFVAERTSGSRDRATETSVKAASQSAERRGPGREAALGVARVSLADKTEVAGTMFQFLVSVGRGGRRRARASGLTLFRPGCFSPLFCGGVAAALSMLANAGSPVGGLSFACSLCGAR